MNCPVCDRSLAPTLSICPTCGAMMHDTVREELQSKVTPCVMPKAAVAPPVPPGPKTYKTPPPAIRRPDTAGLVAPKTSPTLVEFQNKNAPLPDWRIQLQNAVQQRKGGQAQATTAAAPQLAMSAAAATPAPVIVNEAEPTVADPRVANAMRRIAESQKTFHKPEIKPKKARPAAPFGVVTPTVGVAAAFAPARVNAQPKPQLVPPPEKRITNKLPPIPKPDPETLVVKAPVISKVQKLDDDAPQLDFPEATRIEIKAERVDQNEIDAFEMETDEIEDLAPMSMRFGAGLFDLIIGGFAALLLLSPLAFSGAGWTSVGGLVVFLGTMAGVSFLYMTACLGFFGKTMGMRLFSLELVDAVENEYPTLRQAALNSFFFLLSLPLGGAGFLTVFFNEENRAAHDLLSGTILVKEF